MGSTVSDSRMIGLRQVVLFLIGLRFGDCQRFFNIPGASQVKPGGSTRVTPTNNNVLNIRPSSGISLDTIDAAIATSFKTAAAGDDEERVTNRRVLIDQFATPAKQRDEAAATEEESDVEDGGPESVLRQLRKIRKTKSQPSQPTAERSEDSPVKSNIRRVNNIFSQRAKKPEVRKSADIRQNDRATRPSSEDQKLASTLEKLRASRIESSSRREQPSGARAREQPSVATSRERPSSRFQHPTNSERFRGAQVFNPSNNPLGKAEKPRIQQFDDLSLSSEEEEHQSLQPLANEFLPTCPDTTFSYIIPSPTQCDLYYTCDLGTPSRNECDDGLVFSIDQVKCVPSETEDCKDRPLLQTPKGTGACERKNGVFYNNETCTDFVRCRDDTATHEKCADGLVFDPVQKICAWGDEALRDGCLPEDLLGFKCPNPKLTQAQALEARVQLRFGDHDRHPHPTDCRFFYMCLTTGQPRKAGCGRGKVFDRESGVCKHAKDVPECSEYYQISVQQGPGEKNIQVKADSRILKIQEDIRRQFETSGQARRVSQLLSRARRYLLEDAEPED